MRRQALTAICSALCAWLLPSLAFGADSAPAHTGDKVAHVALLISVVLIAAKLGGEVATRLKQPAVLGELLAGMLLGGMPWQPFGEVAADPTIDMLSRIGVLLLLFEVGLESTVRDVLQVGAAAGRIAGLGTVGSFLVGWGVAWLLTPNGTPMTHAFVGAAITATSIGITARVFKDIGQTRSPEARTILGASVLDDIIGLLILALVTGWVKSRAAGHAESGLRILWTLAKTVAVLAIAIWVGVRYTPRLFRAAAGLRTGGVLLAVGLAFCFLLSWAADVIGLAPIIGAFAAGLVLEDLHSANFVARGEKSLTQLIEPLTEFLVPIFFVVMGLRADVRLFLEGKTLAIAAALCIAAVVGKLACAVGAQSGVNRLAIAFGMMPRGEVSLIFANLGMTLELDGAPILDRRGYSALVAVVILTTLLTPPLLKWSFARSSPTKPSGTPTAALGA